MFRFTVPARDFHDAREQQPTFLLGQEAWIMKPSTGRNREAQRIESRYRALISAVAASTSAVGILVVTGWVLGIRALVQLRPDFNVMKFNTALCLIAAGIGLLLILHARGAWRTIAPPLIGLGVFAIGAISLLESLFGWNLHIDQLFWNDLRWHVDEPRMVSQTAVFFVLTGLFLPVSSARQKSIARLGPFLALLANLTAQDAVLDLIFRRDKIEGAAGHTAAAVLALSMGMLLFPNRQGVLAPLLSKSAGGRTIRWLVPAATLVPLFTGWIYLEATRWGLLTPSAGIVAMVILYSVTLVLITVWNAHSIDNVDLRLAAIIDSSDDAILSKTLDGIIMTWNEGAERLYGYSASEAIGKSVLMLVPTECHREQPEFLAQIRRGDSVQHHETVRMRKDGSRFYVSVTLSPLRNANGEITGYSAIARDISERKRADEQIRELNRDLEQRVDQRTRQLQESEHQVRRKLDSILSPQGDIASVELRDILDVDVVQPLMEDVRKLAGIPIFILDLEGNVLVGTGWQEICTRFHRAHPVACQNCIESDCQLTTGVAPGEFRLYKCKNNMWDIVTPVMLGDRHIGNLFSGQFLFDDDMVDTGLFAAQARRYGFDESEYLAALDRVPRLSHARVKAAMELCTRLAGVLSRLGYGGVKLARAMAETTCANTELLHSSKELERFAYSVSHDLRAPLRHMDGFLTLLSKRSYESLDERGKHYVDCTLEASQRMGRLIDELLQFSRLGRSEIHRNPVNLNQVIDDACKELEPELRGRTIIWNIATLPMVTADRPMLRQVLENLIANALKFTRNRTEAVISIGTRPAKDGSLAFFVEDNGAGFDMRYYDKLFQVFQRLHGEDEFEGIGIGLANVRRIVERHGGEVWAEGEVGKGATFYFSLPQEHIIKGEIDEPVETHLVG
jgi:PAS domain S-box-containing protein